MSSLLSASYWDSYLGAQRAGLSTSAAVNYTKQMMPLATQYEKNQLNRIGEWDLRRINAEGSVARDLQRMQGDVAKYSSDNQLKGLYNTNQTAYRTADLTSGRELQGTRYVADKNLEGIKDTNRTAYNTADLTSGRELEGTKYVADKNLAGIDLQSARNLEGTRYVADRGLEGTKYGYDSQERQIGLAGNEQRKTMTHETDQTLALRRDARSQIKTQHARFYG